MNTDRCSDVRSYVVGASAETLRDPPLSLVDHISGCAVCRGALVTLMAELLSDQGVIEISCATCEQSLAGYLELELDEGAAAAMQVYPQVTQHLWTCAECAELHHLTKATVVAARTGKLASPPLSATRPTRTIATFSLARSWLNVALPLPNQRLGAARSPDDEPTVIFERRQADHSFVIAVKRNDAVAWTVTATVTPPADGWFVFGVQEATQRSRLLAGAAAIDAIPVSVIESLDGPDLFGQIELDLPLSETSPENA